MRNTSVPEQAMLMDKWSTRPADHNAKRVRNNQRQHRARVKSRMAELETRLQETNLQLAAAFSTISSLTAEVEALRSRQPSALSPPLEIRPPALQVDPQHTRLPAKRSEHLGHEGPILASTSDSTKRDHLPVSALADISADTNCDCQGAPPPAPGESTMSCSSAFQIIEQQNFSGVEVTTIRAWLGPGFRLKPGEACRVETNKLYEILDHITSPS